MSTDVTPQHPALDNIAAVNTSIYRFHHSYLDQPHRFLGIGLEGGVINPSWATLKALVEDVMGMTTEAARELLDFVAELHIEPLSAARVNALKDDPSWAWGFKHVDLLEDLRITEMALVDAAKNAWDRLEQDIPMPAFDALNRGYMPDLNAAGATHLYNIGETLDKIYAQYVVCALDEQPEPMPVELLHLMLEDTKKAKSKLDDWLTNAAKNVMEGRRRLQSLDEAVPLFEVADRFVTRITLLLVRAYASKPAAKVAV